MTKGTIRRDLVVTTSSGLGAHVDAITNFTGSASASNTNVERNVENIEDASAYHCLFVRLHKICIEPNSELSTDKTLKVYNANAKSLDEKILKPGSKKRKHTQVNNEIVQQSLNSRAYFLYVWLSSLMVDIAIEMAPVMFKMKNNIDMWNRFLNESEIEVVVLMMAWDMLICNEDYIIALIRSDVRFIEDLPTKWLQNKEVLFGAGIANPEMTLWLVNKCIQMQDINTSKSIAKTKTIGEGMSKRTKLKGKQSSIKKY